jgi:hypothetical protein
VDLTTELLETLFRIVSSGARLVARWGTKGTTDLDLVVVCEDKCGGLRCAWSSF